MSFDIAQAFIVEAQKIDEKREKKKRMLAKLNTWKRQFMPLLWLNHRLKCIFCRSVSFVKSIDSEPNASAIAETQTQRATDKVTEGERVHNIVCSLICCVVNFITSSTCILRIVVILVYLYLYLYFGSVWFGLVLRFEFCIIFVVVHFSYRPNSCFDQIVSAALLSTLAGFFFLIWFGAHLFLMRTK